LLQREPVHEVVKPDHLKIPHSPAVGRICQLSCATPANAGKRDLHASPASLLERWEKILIAADDN
jgi:hypothetical protein